MKKNISILIIALMLMTMITGCSVSDTKDVSKEQFNGEKSQGTNQSNQEKKKVFVKGVTSSPSGVFNPLLVDDNNIYVTFFIFESLVNVAPNLEYEPRLAERWEVSDDSRSITFYLRKDVKWHDGKPFTADDVKFSYEFIANKDYKGSRASLISPIDGFNEMKEGNADSLKGVEVLDEHTIKITTTEVYAPFLEKIGYEIKIIPKHIWENVDISKAIEQTNLLRNPIGTGPFKIKEFAEDRYTELDKFSEYWGGDPKLDKVIVQVVNSETAQAQLLNGEIDFLPLSSLNPDDVKIYEDAGFRILKTYGNDYQVMVVNNQNKLLSNKYVRQALTYAIDRQGMVDSLLYGNGNVANTVYPPSFWAHPGEDKINKYEYNPEKAIELLTTKVGWEYKDGKMYANGKAVKLRLFYSKGNRPRELAASIIQENLKNIGIEIELNLMEFPTMMTEVKKDEADSFDMALYGQSIGVDADVRNFLHTNSIFKGANGGRYSNKELDNLLEKGFGSLDREVRKPIYHEVSTIVNEEMPVIYLYNTCMAMVVPFDLDGFEATPRTDSYNSHKWEFK